MYKQKRYIVLLLVLKVGSGGDRMIVNTNIYIYV